MFNPDYAQSNFRTHVYEIVLKNVERAKMSSKNNRKREPVILFFITGYIAGLIR